MYHLKEFFILYKYYNFLRISLAVEIFSLSLIEMETINDLYDVCSPLRSVYTAL